MSEGARLAMVCRMVACAGLQGLRAEGRVRLLGPADFVPSPPRATQSGRSSRPLRIVAIVGVFVALGMIGIPARIERPTDEATRAPCSAPIAASPPDLPAAARHGALKAVRWSAPTPAALGFRWPVRGRVGSGFGWRPAPYRDGREMHAGIDVEARRGAPIGAGADGRVSFGGFVHGYGQVVVLDHGGALHTLYAHLDTRIVSPGMHVRAGQAIGRVGTSGTTTGAHLHFEVRVRGRPVDPARFLPPR